MAALNHPHICTLYDVGPDYLVMEYVEGKPLHGPLPVDEVKRFDDYAHRRRLSVKPGLTCLWQISGRSDVTDFKEWVRLDLEYIDNWSIWLDLAILLRTIPAVFAATGAK